MCVGRSLVTTGEVFNPFGYALIFPRAEQVPAKHVGFSQAVQYIKENGEVGFQPVFFAHNPLHQSH